jgi:DNA-binding transcriptional ArsR family regulator
MARKKASGKDNGKTAKGRTAAKPLKPAKRPRKSAPKEPLDYRYMHALSKKERVRIYAILAERVASPKEISGELGEGLSQVSYHVKVLRECRLIAEDHKVPRRGAVEHFYRAVTPTLIPPDAWDHLPAAMRKSISIRILQEFFEDAMASLETGVFDESPGELGWMPLILDRLGVEEFGTLSREFFKAVLELQATVTKRLREEKDGAEAAAALTSATVFLASFLSARSPDEGTKASATKRR